MTIETDKEAVERASIEGDSEYTLDNDPVYHVYLFYIRVQDDGSLVSDSYFYYSPDPVPIRKGGGAGSLEWYVQDMVAYAKNPVGGKYQAEAKRLSGFRFPPYRAYAVFVMDEPYWKYLADPNNDPIVNFYDNKLGRSYNKHRFAFTKPELIEVDIAGSGPRQAVVMVNRMSNKDDKPIDGGKTEKYCFDFWMRVNYSGSSDGLTIIIDPAGENMGPPGKPPPIGTP